MDDLVAELTLRLQNEMSAGLDEIRSEFAGFDDTLKQLTAVLTDLSAALAALQPPAALLEGMDGIDAAAKAAAGDIGAIGIALDDDATKAKALQDQLNQLHAPAMIQPGVQADGSAMPASDGGEPPPVTPRSNDDDDDPEEPQNPKARGRKPSKPLEAPGGNWIMDLIAVASGFDGEKEYAAFQETALQTAIIEGFSGQAAKDQAQKIMHESYNQAYLSRGNVDDIEEAYFNLIRQQLPHTLVDQMMGPLTEAATTYNVPVSDITQPVFNLADQFKIPGDQMAQAVAILGAASHMGHYYFGDFGQGLPLVATQFEKLGDTGLEGEATAAAALEMVRKSTPDSGTASTDLSYLMTYMTSSIASRFFDRSQRSKDLLGAPVMDLFDKYHIDPVNLPEYLDNERDKGVDPLDAMVDYMHSIGAQKMSPTDESFVFNSLFHSTEASTAMQALVEHYDMFHADQKSLMNISPNFLDQNFQTAIQGDSGGMSQLDLLGTYLYRLYGQNTFGLFGDTSGAPSQSTANSVSPGSSAFNIPINLTVNVDKSGNVTAQSGPGSIMYQNQPAVPPGVNLRVNQGNVLGAP